MIDAIVLLFVLVFGPFVLFRGYARRVEGTNESIEDRLHRLRRASLFGSFAVVGVIIVINERSGFIGTLADGIIAVLPVSGGPMESFVGVVVMFLAFGGAFASISLGTHPVERRLRQTDESQSSVLNGAILGFTMTFVPVVAVILALSAVASHVSSALPVLVGTLAVLVGLVYAFSPYLLLVTSDRIPLTGDRRDRVEQLCADLGYRPRALYLLDGTEGKEANAMVAGTVPGYRYVFLTDYLVERCSDEELRAILAHEFGHIERRHLWQQSVATVALFGGAIVLDSQFGIVAWLDSLVTAGGLVGVLGLFVLYFVGVLGGLSLRHEYQADAYAAEKAGPEAMIDGLRRIADANDTREDVGILYSLVTFHPPISDRIDALQSAAPDGVRESEQSASHRS